jgi:hypothetical protein
MSPFYQLGSYFRPVLLLRNAIPYGGFFTLNFADFVIEGVKWSILFAIAVMLTIAQLTARRKSNRL